MEQIVFPGTVVPAAHPNLKLGPGLVQVFQASGENHVLATKAGELRSSSNKRNWWIESNCKRYVPVAQESVIGTVVGRNGADGWRVDIGAAHSASLDALAFEGATKRSRPNLKINSLVYGRISTAHKDMDPELECFDAQTRKAEDYGELTGGLVVKCSLGLCRRLLDPTYFLLPKLGTMFPLEVIVAVNGRVWFRTPEVLHAIAVARCLEAADMEGGGQSDDEVKRLINKLEI